MTTTDNDYRQGDAGQWKQNKMTNTVAETWGNDGYGKGVG